jgi:hypothetical protein
VPTGGLPAWSRSDATEQPVARLDPGLEVHVVERWGDWANIRCSNGWTAWVDGRRLEAIDSVEPVLVATSARAAGPTTRPVSGSVGKLGWSRSVVVGGRTIEIGLPAIGAVLALVGSMLDWFSTTGLSASSFDVKLNFLVSPKSDPSGPDIGLVLLAAIVGVAVLVVVGTRERERRWIGGAVAAVAGVFVVQLQRWLSQFPEDQRPGLFDTIGLGVWLTLVGGALMVLPRPSGGAAR